MTAAPRRLAPSVAQRPVGPWANTATASPIRTPAASMPRQARRQDVRDEQHVVVREAVGDGRQVRRRVRHEQVLRPRAVDRVAEAPAARRAAALRRRAVEAVVALAARRDGGDDDALADGVVVVQARAELVDDADRLVAEHQAARHAVLAAHDAHVGRADAGRRDADDGLVRARRRLRPLLDRHLIPAAEDHRFHRRHVRPLAVHRTPAIDRKSQAKPRVPGARGAPAGVGADGAARASSLRPRRPRRGRRRGGRRIRREAAVSGRPSGCRMRMGTV